MLGKCESILLRCCEGAPPTGACARSPVRPYPARTVRVRLGAIPGALTGACARPARGARSGAGPGLVGWPGPGADKGATGPLGALPGLWRDRAAVPGHGQGRQQGRQRRARAAICLLAAAVRASDQGRDHRPSVLPWVLGRGLGFSTCTTATDRDSRSIADAGSALLNAGTGARDSRTGQAAPGMPGTSDQGQQDQQGTTGQAAGIPD